MLTDNMLTMKKNMAISATLISAFLVSVVMAPTKRIADVFPKIDLETMIPKQFGEWRIDDTVAPVITSPDIQANLNLIYNQTLNRSYINERGDRLMLAIAYGGDQSDSMQVHKPEVCYPAQGFQIIRQKDGMLDSGFGVFPVRWLVAQQGQRIEPVTYWIKIGDSVVSNGVQWKLKQLAYGLTGRVPDGMLFRVSSISANENSSFEIHQSFIRSILESLPKELRTRLIGGADLMKKIV